MTSLTWLDAAHSAALQVQESLLSVSEWAARSHADARQRDALLQPYRDLLESVYLTDFPLAKLADESDLLLHIKGPSASGPSPKVSVVAGLLTKTRDQVTKLAKLMGGVTATRVPAGLDMSLVGIARGSLFIGFSSSDQTDQGGPTLLAVDAIVSATRLIVQGASVETLSASLPDPAERDMAVDAVRGLSPSGMIGVSEIDILGRRVGKTVTLTTDTRRTARRVMAERIPVSAAPVVFVGTVREVDLDACRFEIRGITGVDGAIRCAHELEEEVVKSIVDMRVRVTGTPEYAPGGRAVRLLWVSEIELLTP